jgi:hypothetical protein
MEPGVSLDVRRNVNVAVIAENRSPVVKPIQSLYWHSYSSCFVRIISLLVKCTRVSKKVKELLKIHIFCKYTEMKLILLFNVTPPPPPRLQRTGSSVSQVFFNSVRKSFFFFFLVAPLTSFAPRQFLERIITADETWMHRYEPESKAHSMAWKRPTSPVAKKFKSQPSAGEIMLTLFWDMAGVILVHFTPKVKPLTLKFPYVWPNERSFKRKKIFIQ